MTHPLRRVALTIGLASATVSAASGFQKLLVIQAPRGGAVIARAGGCNSTISGEKPAHVDLSVTLTKLNRSDLALGGQLVADIVVTNIGDASISIPWSQNPPERERVSAPTAFASVIAIDSSGERDPVIAAALFGDAEHAGSMLELHPMESATIRIPGWLTLPSERARVFAAEGGKNVLFAARFSMSLGECKWTELNSRNTVPVVLRYSPR